MSFVRFLSFVALLIVPGLAPADTQPDRPNVLFIAVDDLNDWVGFLKNHPGVKTPNLDRLAARGVVFTNAHCAAPACAPSRAALLTGLSPARTGVYLNRHDWREAERTKDVATIPDSFREAGYLTRGGGKIYHAHTIRKEALKGYLDPEPWDQYFPSKSQQLPAERTPPTWPVNTLKKFYLGRFDWAPLSIADEEMADAKVVTWAEKQLATKHDKPLFLAVGIYRPHIPWWTPEKYFEEHPLEKLALPKTPEGDLDDVPVAGKKFARTHWQKWIVDNDQWKKAVQGYLASMTFADAMVGRLIAALDNGPLADNTVIVLWSDHGYHLGHKQHWEKFALWEQATHVPLLFVDSRGGTHQTKQPWMVGGRCDQPASLLDVYPTLAEICNLKKPETLDGKSLLPQLRDPAKKTGRAVVTTHGFRNHAVRSDRWRYIRYADGSEELYDHSSDPAEHTNLASKKDLTEIKRDLARWLPTENRNPDGK